MFEALKAQNCKLILKLFYHLLDDKKAYLSKRYSYLELMKIYT